MKETRFEIVEKLFVTQRQVAEMSFLALKKKSNWHKLSGRQGAFLLTHFGKSGLGWMPFRTLKGKS